MKGTLYGIGVGPGDPELLTLKAVRTIKECQVIALPVSDASFTEVCKEAAGDSQKELQKYKEGCVAYQIALPAVPELKEKEIVYLPMPMTKEKELLDASHDKAMKALGEILDNGKDIAFLTLGDPTVYSTYLYVHKRMAAANYKTGIISGIPSFCAAAARLNTGLVETSEQLHVIPASYQIEEALELPGTKVLMKTGKKMEKVKQILQEKNVLFAMVENCGMKNEKIYHDITEVNEKAGYYSLMIINEEA